MKPGSRSNSRLLQSELSSAADEVDGFCSDARELLSAIGLSSEIFPVEMLLRESLNNAMFHGNGGDRDKRIRAEVRIGRKWIFLRVEDEGEGFDSRKARTTVPDPESCCGRGLAIYSLYAHRIAFNSKGNRVSFWRAMTGEGRTVHDYELKRDGNKISVILEGDLTASTVPGLKPVLQKAVNEGVVDVEFDVGKATIIDSSGIGLLIATYNSVTARGGAVRVVLASEDICQLLRSMRLENRLCVSTR